MDISWHTLLIVCPLTFLAGLVDSIAGGGGLISLPAFLLAGLPPHAAIATNKLSSSIGTTVSTARFLKNGYVNVRIAVPAVIVAVLGANLGARLILKIPEHYIRYFLLFALPAAAFFVLRKKPAGTEPHAAVSPRRQLLLAVIMSFLIGVYDGFYGPGTGTFLLLIYTGLCCMTVQDAAGTVKLVNLSSNVMSLFIFLREGQAVLWLGCTAGAFCLLGHYLGSGMVMKNGGKIVRPVILGVLALLFLKVLGELLH